MSIIEEQPIGTSRRDLFALIGTGALLTAATAARAQSGGSLSQKQLQAKLLRRISYGPTEADMAAIASLGYDAYLEQQLNPTAIADVACDALLTQFPSLKYGSRQLFMADNQTLRYEQTSAMLVRAIYSNRQLLERMVEFWTDHFNIYWPTVRTLKAAHDRDVIRANALGNFGDLLLANARSGAMMKYLDNGSNRKAGPNENYARELLELHTMGVNNGYTQQDIIEIARCFTGWTVQLDPTASNAGAFYYDSLRHDGGAKTVLGRRIKAGGGVNDGTTVIQILTGRKETASYLSKKLCTFFLGHAPKALVDDLTRSFQSTGGEIKPLLRLILKQANVTAAPLVFKRPLQYSIGLLRQSGAKFNGYVTLRQRLTSMCHLPFNWPTPDGYPMDEAYWSNSMVARWNFAFGLFDHTLGEISTDRTFLNGAISADEILGRINEVYFQGEMTTTEKDRVRVVLEDASTTPYWNALKAAAFATTLPSYQRA